MNFNKSVVATFVGAAISSFTFGAAASESFSTSAIKPINNVLSKHNSKHVNSPTKSGMVNQFDKTIGKNTFQWAAQNESVPNLGPVPANKKLAVAADFYLNKLTGFSSDKTGVTQAVLANVHDIGRGAKIAKYKQKVGGVDVFNREYNVMMDKHFNLVAASGYFADKKSTATLPAAIKDLDGAFGEASKSIEVAFSAIGGDTSSVTLSKKDTSGGFDIFSVQNSTEGNQLVGEPRAKRVFFEHKGQLVAAHYVEVERSSDDGVDSTHFSYVISAKTGEVLFEKNLVSHEGEFTYRVYADADGKPWDSPHGNVIPAPQDADPDAWMTAEYLTAPLVSISAGPISTMDPWLADDATTTSGNNVFAYLDAIAPQGFSNGDYTAETTSANTFDYSYRVDEAEYSINNRKAAIVNLFYVNNYLHNEYYDHGFDEASGNAQVDNYERGGEGNDPLNVEVQDYSGFNNANMSTPADGYSPRMQMYLWDKTFAANGVSYGLTATSNPELGVDGLLQTTLGASFGPLEYEAFSGKLVEIVDGTDPTRDGCEEAVNAEDLAGNIAIIDRGACAFVEKVRNAQTAGAIAVVVANNRDGDTAIIMGGDNFDDIVIPSMMISENEGASVYAAMAEGDVTVSMFREDVSRSFKDSSWDNGTVAHEWGHYISNRLVGNSSGLSSLQARSMGEGFGDFHALLFLSEEDDNLLAGNESYGLGYSDSPYIRSFVYGIRNYPYSTNMEINPQTFEDVSLYPDLVHAPGSIFATMLWDSFVDMVNDERHTFDEAKSLMKDYLVAGYKMMPMAPTFTEGRDAILAAAYANDEEDYKVILAAFARRGMGLGAESPSRFATDHAGVVESYDTELATFSVASHDLNVNYEGLMTGYCSSDNILDKGETGTVSFTVQNGGSEVLSGLTGVVEVVSDHDVTFANDGMVTIGDLAMFGSATSTPIEFTLNEAGTGDEVVLQLTFPDLAEGTIAADYSLSTTANVDFEERPLVGTSQYEDLNTLSRLNDFTEVVMTGDDMAIDTFGLAQWSADDGFIYATNNSFESDVSFETRPMTVGFDGDFTVSFWHYYNIEATWDGAVVEVSLNGGDWVDVLDAGATFLGDGYRDTMLADTTAAIAGQEAFTGQYYNAETGAFGGFETISFGESINGNQVQFRFRMSTDGAAAEDGWYIDDLTFTNIQTSIFTDVVAGDTFACDNRMPFVSSISDDTTVDEGSAVNLSVEGMDPNNDELTYSWSQTSGVEVTLTGADMADVSFTAPEVTGNQTLEFTAMVSDGTESASQTVTVSVNDTTVRTPPTTSNGSSSGGGSTGWLSLLLLPLMMLRRRK